jgi:hypothetical protein
MRAHRRLCSASRAGVLLGWQCRAGQGAVAAVGEGGDGVGQGPEVQYRLWRRP